jgi:hypothetical protein
MLPYFGGAAGEACRVAAVAAWEAQNSTQKQNLEAVMSTELFQTAASYCQPQIDMYNQASAVVCLLERQNNYSVTYAAFWEGGDFFFDGAYDLASMFAPTANFTQIGGFATCGADCYTGIGSGCDGLSPDLWMTNYGKISVEEYCDTRWAGIDAGYLAVKLCAAKAIAQPAEDSGISKEDYVETFQFVQATEGECVYKFCSPSLSDAIEASICPSDDPTDTSRSDTFMYMYFDPKWMAVATAVLVWLFC